MQYSAEEESAINHHDADHRTDHIDHLACFDHQTDPHDQPCPGVGPSAPQQTNTGPPPWGSAHSNDQLFQKWKLFIQKIEIINFFVDNLKKWIIDQILQAALKALDVAPDKIEPSPRISSVLMET